MSMRSVRAASAPSAAHGEGIAVRDHVVLGDEDAVEADVLGHLRGAQHLLPAPADILAVRRVLGRNSSPNFIAPLLWLPTK